MKASVLQAGAVLAIAGLGATLLMACSNNSGGTSSTGSSAATGAPAADLSALKIDNAKWQYDADNNVYYQLGISYATTPQAPDYETLSIVVPGAYMNATNNGDGTYTATANREATVGEFTGATAPIVMPLNTPGYSAQKPMTEYSYDSVSSYVNAGMIYVLAGMRGKDSHATEYTGNAPWGVTDAKAAIRYLRFNADDLAGDAQQVFVAGHSGGGAQSAIVGASGDSELYTPYLNALGAAMTDANGNALSDAPAGVMARCPITSLDEANSAYEWNMGQFATTGTRAAGTWTEAYSKDLAAQFAQYLNQLELKDADGNPLTLEESPEGIYQAGSYYDSLVQVVQQSLNDFLAVTSFPYTPSNEMMAGMGTGMGASGAAAQSGGTGAAPSGEAPTGAPPSGAPGGSSQAESTTYNTVEDYIAYLNTDSTWVEYDAATNTARVTDLAGFVNSQKEATKDVGALDGVDRGQTENTVFGIGADQPLHFSASSGEVISANEEEYSGLSDWSADYAGSAYASDMETTDALGVEVKTRQDMYNPMYYLNDYYAGVGTSTVAPAWRIRTGIQQGDTASTVEYNLHLALQELGVTSDFGTIWGKGHTMAELEGDATTNLIEWITFTVKN